MSVLDRLRRWRSAPAQTPDLSLENHPLLDRDALEEARRLLRKLRRQQARQPAWSARRRHLTDELLNLAVDVDLMERAQALPLPTMKAVDRIRAEFYELPAPEQAARVRAVIG